MSIVQFLRIFWARRFIAVATMIACLIGAALVVLLVPPRYEAHARVMLNLLKPDPVTGEVLQTGAARTYVATQIELLRDYKVAGQAVDALGWANDPGFQARYAQRGSRDTRDIRRWLSQIVIDNSRAEVVQGSNVLEISYFAPSAIQASAMANALRDAYIDSDINLRRQEANRNADWYTQQAAKAKTALDAADAAKGDFEHKTGLVMTADNIDIETARLRAMSANGASAMPVIMPPSLGNSPSAMAVAQIDAQIAQSQKTLGPNHPVMIELKARRAAAIAQAAQEAAASRAAAAAAAGAAAAPAAALNRAMMAQASKVVANRDKLEQLSQLQTEVNLRREQYQKTLARAAEYRQQAAVADTGIANMGDAVPPEKPKFPNKPLIFGGALIGGLGMGVLVGLIRELLDRRVRSADDLESLQDIPLLAIIGDRRSSRRRKAAPALPFSGIRRPGAIT